MKVRITAPNFIVPVGTVLDVGPEAPRSWGGKYEVVDEPVEVEVNEGWGGTRDDTPVAYVKPANPFRAARTSRKRDPG